MIPAGLRMDPAVRAFFKAAADRDQLLTGFLTERLGPMIGQAMSMALSDSRLLCARCAIGKAEFNLQHQDQIMFAHAQACAQRGVDPESDEAMQLQALVVAFLPAELQPSPDNPVEAGRWNPGFPGYTQIGGDVLCVFHVAELVAARPGPSAPPAAPPKPILLANTSSLSAAVAALGATPAQPRPA